MITKQIPIKGLTWLDLIQHTGGGSKQPELQETNTAGAWFTAWGHVLGACIAMAHNFCVIGESPQPGFHRNAVIRDCQCRTAKTGRRTTPGTKLLPMTLWIAPLLAGWFEHKGTILTDCSALGIGSLYLRPQSKLWTVLFIFTYHFGLETADLHNPDRCKPLSGGEGCIWWYCVEHC